MSDTPNPEQSGGLLEQIDFENYANPFGKVQIELLDDDYVFFEANLPVDILLIGGSDSVDNTYDPQYPLKSHRTFREIRSRLGLSAIDLGDFEDINGSVGMYFDKAPNDVEAWFLMLLPLCTKEFPMEMRIRQLKEFAGLSVQEGLKISPNTFDSFCNALKANDIPYKEVILKALYSSEHIRRTVRRFARYKQLQEALRSRSSGNPEGAIRELIEIENDLDQDLVVANRVIRNTRFNIQLVTPVTDPKDERYHRDYPYVPSNRSIDSMTPAEKSQLELAVLPWDYESKRQSTIADEFFRASSDWFN